MPVETSRSRSVLKTERVSFVASTGADAPPAEQPESTVAGDHRRRSLHTTTVVVITIGGLLTVMLVAATWAVSGNNEDRLLRQRTREAAAVLTAALPGIETPLASATEVVEESDGADQSAFRRLLTPIVEEGRPYVSAGLWTLDGDDTRPLVVVGTDPKLASQPPETIRALLERAAATDGLTVIALLDGDDPRLGYALTSPRSTVRFVAYAEAALPPARTAVVPSDSAFTGLHNAVYLGDAEDPDLLLTASTPDLPLEGRRASEQVPFGDTTLLLVMSPDGALGGRLLEVLPWLVGAFWLLTTFGSATLIEWLLRRRDDAERLSRENARLYAGQRSVAQTLQHSLLPERLPELAGADLAFRYLPGTDGMDIGGDWYDAIPLDDHSVMIVVGDVSGRGLKAGAIMASLRYSIRAFASQGDGPSTILTKLTRLLDIDLDRHFATVLCCTIDLAERTISIANAGHPNPLLILGDDGRFIETRVGVPIGVTRGANYEVVTETIPSGATVLVFTDGLFERRGEPVDDGLERLRESARATDGSLEDLLTQIVNAQTRDASHDDTAILGMRWRH